MAVVGESCADRIQFTVGHCLDLFLWLRGCVDMHFVQDAASMSKLSTGYSGTITCLTAILSIQECRPHGHTFV